MWLLVWIYFAPAGTLETQIQYAAVKEVVMSSREQCERALTERLDVNDTRYMIAHRGARLVCVEVPK